MIFVLIPKKVELLIWFFEPFWLSRVFCFSLGTFAKVERLPGPLTTSDETYSQSKFDISGSNETMQNSLALIVYFWRIFEIFSIFQEFQKFSSDLSKICYGGMTLGKDQHRMFLKWLRLSFDQPNRPTKAEQ